MELCEYGCGKEYKYIFKNGKKCCSLKPSKCPSIKKKIKESCTDLVRSEETRKKMSISQKGHFISEETKLKIKKSNQQRNISKSLRIKMGIGIRLSISRIKKKYNIFFKEEEIRYNPDKNGEKEIQVHCKNHNCLNSKEMGGWFIPTKSQLSERIRQVEIGNGGSYFYCSDECKNKCPLFNIHSDPCKNTDKLYTDSEYQTFRTFVLERDNYECQFCGQKATDVHHEKPQKLEPFFALDPDFAWSCCKECHYKYGHQDECSTRSLSTIICK